MPFLPVSQNISGNFSNENTDTVLAMTNHLLKTMESGD